mgnify:CR=1 FL=1
MSHSTYDGDRFSEFLHSQAILSNEQKELLRVSFQKHQDSSLITQLADFFNSLTPSDFYDLAERLHAFWQHQLLPGSPKIKEKSHSLSTLQAILYGNQSKRSTKPSRNKSLGHIQLLNESGVNSSGRNSVTKESIHERLYNESTVLKNIKVIREEIKKQSELQPCTFQPEIPHHHDEYLAGSSQYLSAEVFDRLAKDTKKTHLNLCEEIKKQLDLKECTFQPNVRKSGSGHSKSRDQSTNHSFLNQTFERLYNENMELMKKKLEGEKLKQEQEMKECTFSPKVNARKKHPTASSEKKSPRDSVGKRKHAHALYEDFFDREKHKMQLRMDITAVVEKELTFKPQLISKQKARDPSDKKVAPQDRLLEWEKERVHKLNIMKEQKRRETEGDGKPIRYTVDKPPKNNTESGYENRYERLYQDGALRKARTNVLEKQRMDELGCTFYPKLVTSKSGSRLRTRGGSPSSPERDGYFHDHSRVDLTMDSSVHYEPSASNKENAQPKHRKTMTQFDVSHFGRQSVSNKIPQAQRGGNLSFISRKMSTSINTKNKNG